MNNTLRFDTHEHGQLISTPLEYGIGGSKNQWWAYVRCKLTNEEGYLNHNGTVIAPLIDGIDGLFGEWLKSESEAENACQKHFNRLSKSIDRKSLLSVIDDALDVITR